MTMFNVVRFRVKAGRDEDFLGGASRRKGAVALVSSTGISSRLAIDPIA